MAFRGDWKVIKEIKSPCICMDFCGIQGLMAAAENVLIEAKK
jgi:hypothetical protein